MVDSDSSLSSPPSSEDEMPANIMPVQAATPSPQKKKKKKNGTILTFFKQRSPSPPPRKRPASPARAPMPEDNPQIAFVVMFRSRFNEAFPRGAPSVGPQDIEQGVLGETPSPDVEGLLCALLGLVLNRKKPVEKGHYGRALEEAIQTQKSQWPAEWSKNPLSGGQGFNTMSPTERIRLLHTLALWSLNQNEQVKLMINNAYKSRTTKDRLDTNIPLSVQPWGRDGDKRRYWLVEGQNDTHFRIYRESDPKYKNVQWISVAGSIEELRVLATKLDGEDGHKEAKTLGERMINAIPRFEASENKRKRREYRVQRNAAFTRPDPGFSLYEGRTRGKRQRYTFDEEEDFYSDGLPSRRSGRQSGRDSPTAPSGPTVTASGRQVRSRAIGLYGETLHSGQVTDRASPATADYARSDMSEEPRQGRSTRAANRGVENGRGLKRAIDSDDEDDATSWDGGDEDDDEPDQMDVDDDDDEEDAADEDEDEDENETQSLVVTLRYGKGASHRPGPPLLNGNSHHTDSTSLEHQSSSNPAPKPISEAGALQHLEPSVSVPPQEVATPVAIDAAPSHTVAPLAAETTNSDAHPGSLTQTHAPVVPVAKSYASTTPTTTEATSAKVDESFAPTPPYGALEKETKSQQFIRPPPVQVPVVHTETQQRPPQMT